MKMSADQLEFAISRYIDDALPEPERSALEEVLARDAEARQVHEEYRRLDALVRADAHVPQVRWDKLESHLAGALAHEELPGRSFAMPWLRNAGRIAIAASVLLVVGLGIISYRSHESAPLPARVEIVVGPSNEPATATLVEQIAIGPSPQAAHEWRYADAGVIARPTVVLIDRAPGPVQDIEPMPY